MKPTQELTGTVLSPKVENLYFKYKKLFTKYLKIGQVPQNVVRKFERLEQDYPDVNSFSNLLGQVYVTNKYYDKAKQFYLDLIERLPDYLFAKIALVSLHLELDEPEKTEEIIPESMGTLQDLDPSKDIFQVSEYNFFESFLDRVNKTTNAIEVYIEIFDAYSHALMFLKKELDKLRIALSMARLAHAHKHTDTVKVTNKIFFEASTEKPEFSQSEVETLLSYNLYDNPLPIEELEAILELSKDILTEDLEKILAYAQGIYIHSPQPKNPEYFKEILKDALTYISPILAELQSKQKVHRRQNSRKCKV